jgi:hypothetical protein
MAEGIVAFHAMRGSGYLSTGQEKPDLLTGASVYGFSETMDCIRRSRVEVLQVKCESRLCTSEKIRMFVW